MRAQVTLNLPESVYLRAERLAERSGSDIRDILTTTLNAALPDDDLEEHPNIAAMSDERVLALCNSQMDVEQNVRMSNLLEAQQARTLMAMEQLELSLLLYRYQTGTLRKAEALAEAVRRGLMPPLSE
jgi:hypothetical protein